MKKYLDSSKSLEACTVCLITCHKHGSMGEIIIYLQTTFLKLSEYKYLIELFGDRIAINVRLKASTIELVTGSFLGMLQR
jgi:endonuclease IV